MKFVMMLSLMAVCPNTQYFNKSEEPWTTADRDIIERNRAFCIKKYDAKPCITRFIKLAKRTYYIECGKKRGK